MSYANFILPRLKPENVKKKSIWPFNVESGEKIGKRRLLGFLINECL